MNVTNQTVGHYQILDMIDKGGMGVVYRAKHVSLKRMVALKLLPPSRLKGKLGLLRFQREIEILARMNHPNIATAYDSGTSGELHYLVMELIEGQSLRSLVNARGPLPIEEALGYVRQAAQGLAYAHGEGVIHRDIKPSNLMLTNDGVVKILDLGVARIIHNQNVTADHSTIRDLTSQLTFVGTAEYSSPEQASDSSSVSARSDVYSLGCTLYFLLTGKPVFHGKSTMEFLMSHQSMPRPSVRAQNRDIPRSVDRLLMKMLAIAPEKRFASMEEVIEAIDGLSLDPSPRVSGIIPGIGLALLVLAIFASGKFQEENQADPPVIETRFVDNSPDRYDDLMFGLEAKQEFPDEYEKYLWINLAHLTQNGRHAVIAGGRFDSGADTRYPVTIRNLADWTIAAEFTTPRSWTWCGAESPDGKHLLVGTGGSPELTDGKQLGGDDFAVYVVRLNAPNSTPVRFGLHRKAISGAAFLTGDRIVSGSFDETLRLFDAVDAEELREYENPFGEVLALAASPDRKRFATGHFDSVAIWDPESGTHLINFAFPLAKAVAFSGDNSRLAVGGNGGSIVVWDIQQRRIVQEIEHFSERVNCIAWCHHGHAILTGHNDGTLNLCDLRTNELLRRETIEETPIKCLSVSPDSTTAISGSSDGVVRLWKLSAERKRTNVR